MKKLLINNQKTANYLNFLMFFYILLFIVLPLQLSVLVPNSIFGTFFSDYKLLGLFTFVPVLLFFYTGVFYNLIKIDSYIIDIKVFRTGLMTILGIYSPKDYIDISHEMFNGFSFYNRPFSFNTTLMIKIIKDNDKIIVKRFNLSFISKKEILRISKVLNQIIAKNS